MVEEVVLVNEVNEVLGTMAKSEVHGVKTPLHRGFSLFLFNSKGDLLLQQRSHLKKTWPLVWSNSCCGHPSLNEENIEAAFRRSQFELGLTPEFIKQIAPYRYSFTREGVMENEICPILIGFVKDTEFKPNSEEVEAIKWIDWKEFLKLIRTGQSGFSEWCVEEAEILDQNVEFQKFYQTLLVL